MERKLRIGVVGAGWPSWQHMRGYREMTDVELVALCDANPERLHEIGDRFEVPARYTDYEEMLDKEQLDAVSVCTPNAFHAGMTIAALERGAHVHCEKPMATTSADARKMAQAAEKADRVLMVGFQRRFSPEADYLKRFIESGAAGEIYAARAVWVRRRGIPGMGGWFTTKNLSGGGALIDIGVHVLDLALWYMGFPEPVGVSATVGARFGSRGKGQPFTTNKPVVPGGTFDVDDYAFAHVSFSGKRALLLETSWASHIKQDLMSVEVKGEKAGARLWPLEIYTDELGMPVDIVPTLQTADSHSLSTRHFVDVIRGKAELICRPEEGVRGIELIERIYAAAQ